MRGRTTEQEQRPGGGGGDNVPPEHDDVERLLRSERGIAVAIEVHALRPLQQGAPQGLGPTAASC